MTKDNKQTRRARRTPVSPGTAAAMEATMYFGGLFALLCITTVVFWMYNSKTQREAAGFRSEAEMIAQRTQKLLQEISALEEAKNDIATRWSQMQRWFPGPTQASDFGILRAVGFAVTPPAPFPGTSGSVAAIAFRATSSTTEYQRFALALSKTEEKFGFLQLYTLTMSLPDGVQPMGLEPTYLDIQAEFYHPQTTSPSGG